MPGSPGSGVVVFRRTGSASDIDAINEYSRRLTDALVANGIGARYEPAGLSAVLNARRMPDWVLLQYNPFRYGRAGFAPGLLRDAMRLKRAGVPLAVMVHEAWVNMNDPRTTLIGSWQRVQLRGLLRLADAVMTSTETLAHEIGHDAVHLPVASNIAPVPVTHQAARDSLSTGEAFVVALFGRAHESRALDHAEAAITALAAARGPHALAILNLGADAPPVRVPPGVELRSPGRQSPEQLSVGLSASDVVLLPFTDGVSTRRGTLMAALAHGRPVLGLTGHNTDTILARARDALWLTPAGSPVAFARATVALTAEPARLGTMGAAARRLYETHFDWPVLTRKVEAAIASISATERPATAVAVPG